MKPIRRALIGEALGTALLLAVVVGSGIMGERLAGGNMAVALLANALATGAALVVLIQIFGPISGAHFNPVVTLVDAWQGGRSWRDVPGYLFAQLGGALVGVAIAHTMFELPLYTASTHLRTGASQWFSEFIATFGLIATLAGCGRQRSAMVPFAVGAYITSAYWFTASTAFSNPAVTLARSFTNTFSGIRPDDIGMFILAQLLGAFAAAALFDWLLSPVDRQE